MTRVLILQPVITHNGISLFKALAARPGLELRVLASPRVPGAPSTVDNLPNRAVAAHRCRALVGERLFLAGGSGHSANVAARRCMRWLLATVRRALHLALVSLGIRPGDEVIVPDLTWQVRRADGTTPV